ncbi:MAG: P1 family peptidase [Ilumatobacteraceae bacterium]
MMIDAGSLTDVAGIRVGHYERSNRNWNTGTTVILADHPVTAGVDVRGGGPGTRETDALSPMNLVEHIDAICLTGGSAFGLRAADGVVDELADRGRGFSVGTEPHQVVPVVPSAVIFDLGRGGHFRHHPDADFGRRATKKASQTERRRGSIGAGTGAVAGGLSGGIGMASGTLVLNDEHGEPTRVTVAALCVVNARGSLINPLTGRPWEAHPGVKTPNANDRRGLANHLDDIETASLNTTIGVVATDARLDRSEATRLAMSTHDGLSRAIRPVHTLADGDTMFAMATGAVDLGVTERTIALSRLSALAADITALACVDAVIHATPMATVPSYTSLCPSALR